CRTHERPLPVVCVPIPFVVRTPVRILPNQTDPDKTCGPDTNNSPSTSSGAVSRTGLALRSKGAARRAATPPRPSLSRPTGPGGVQPAGGGATPPPLPRLRTDERTPDPTRPRGPRPHEGLRAEARRRGHRPQRPDRLVL